MPTIDITGAAPGAPGAKSKSEKLIEDLLTSQRRVEALLTRAIKNSTAVTAGRYSAGLANAMGQFRAGGGLLTPEMNAALSILQRRGGVLNGVGGRNARGQFMKRPSASDESIGENIALIAKGIKEINRTAQVGAGRGGALARYVAPRFVGGLPMRIAQRWDWNFSGRGPGGSRYDGRHEYHDGFTEIPQIGFGGGRGGIPPAGRWGRGGGPGASGSGLPALYNQPGRIGVPGSGGMTAGGIPIPNVVGTAAAVALAAGLVKAVNSIFSTAPSQIWNLVSNQQASEPFMRLKTGTYAVGRSGGWNPGDLGSLFGRGNDEWMKRFGVGPDQVLATMQAFGISPRSEGDFKAIASAILQETTRGTSFAGLPAGAVEGLARQGVGLGLAQNTGAGVGGYLQKFSGVMGMAVAGGMDRSRLLESMQGSLEQIAARGASGINVGGLSSLYQTMMAGGTLGGRTGSAAASVAAGAGGFASGFGNRSIETMAFINWARGRGGLGSEASVQSALGMSDERFAALKGHPGAARALQDVISQWSNPATRGMAGYPFQALIAGDPELAARIALQQGRALAGGHPGFGVRATGTMLNLDAGTAYGLAAGADFVGPRQQAAGMPSAVPESVYIAQWRAATAAAEGSAASFVQITEKLNNFAESVDKATTAIDKFFNGGPNTALPSATMRPGYP